MSVVKVTCFADGRPNRVEELSDDSPEAQAILNPPPRPIPGPSLADRLAVLEAAAQLPDGIPHAFAAAKEAAAIAAPDKPKEAP